MLYHKVKQEELYILLRGYHRSEDVYSLLHSAIGHNDDFKDFVFRSYKEVDDVSRFAALANMSVRNFQRKFKSEFGCSVREWLIERRAESILWDIRGTDKRISDLASDYGFSTPSSFTSFCKRHFGLTPLELRRQPRTLSSQNMQASFPDFPEAGKIPRPTGGETSGPLKTTNAVTADCLSGVSVFGES
ncbi:helix-turn-helix transcriptional regulator [Alistipes putredinis]|uniref:helix-turn-helix transcriptional regulator n=1 Tax=Alistipes putredinis TaxID=28117 RepID=UPI003AB5E91B